MTQSRGYGPNAKSVYNYELGNYSSSTTYNAKIGMMYVSDYYYAANPKYWSYYGYDENNYETKSYAAAVSSNWMYNTELTWTITRTTDLDATVFYIWSFGNVVAYYRVWNLGAHARPVFYLNSNITYTGGSGTSSDPIRIN